VLSGGSVWALDRATGDRAWTYAGIGVQQLLDTRPVALGEGLLAFSEPAVAGERVHVVDAATGVERFGFHWRGTVGGMHIARGALYVSSRDTTGDALVAYDTGSGRRLWAYRPALDSQRRDGLILWARFERFAYLPLVARNTRRIVASAPDELHVVDLASGGLVWTQPLGDVRALAVVPRGEFAPVVVGQVDERDSVALRPGAQDTLRRVTIAGTMRWATERAEPIPDLHVRVGSQTVVTDASGGFHVALLARGPVPVVPVDLPQPPGRENAGGFGLPRTWFVYIDASRDHYEMAAAVEIRHPR